MRKTVFDIETNGLLDKEDLKVWCWAAYDLGNGTHKVGTDPEELFDLLMTGGWNIGHNIAGFDYQVLERVLGAAQGTLIAGDAQTYDTLIASQMTYSDEHLKAASYKLRNSFLPGERDERMPEHLCRRHSLEAWGKRFSFEKMASPDFEAGFDDYMAAYCLNDVMLNVKLYERLTERGLKKGWPPQGKLAVHVESINHYLNTCQEVLGVRFDVKAAEALYLDLMKQKEEILAKLQEVFPPVYVPKSQQNSTQPEPAGEWKPAAFRKITVPKANRKVKGVEYTKGAAFSKVELQPFNPGSDQQVAFRLIRDFGWVPGHEEYTPGGQPKVSEDILKLLPYDCIPHLLSYMTINKRLGQLGDGSKAWLKAERKGRIHGRVNTIGTRTHRCSHTSPNLGQVPRLGNPYGAECRSLFIPSEGKVLVGVDASGLEMRTFGHYLSCFGSDAEKWVQDIILSGDIHSDWMKLTGIKNRDNQKTLTYALLYGAGNFKLGRILYKDRAEAGDPHLPKNPEREYFAVLGKTARNKLLRNVPGLKSLYSYLANLAQRGWFQHNDGRIIEVTSEHKALNDLCQSLGTIIMKHAAYIMVQLGYGRLDRVLYVHDEWQYEVEPQHADVVGEAAVASIIEAGKSLSLRVPLDAEYKVGESWSHTH